MSCNGPEKFGAKKPLEPVSSGDEVCVSVCVGRRLPKCGSRNHPPFKLSKLMRCCLDLAGGSGSFFCQSLRADSRVGGDGCRPTKRDAAAAFASASYSLQGTKHQMPFRPDNG